MSNLIDLIKQLRERTGSGIMDCKKALLANDNDVQKAADWLREKGITKQANKAATRIAAEGVAWVMVNGNKAVVVELNSETDFVANSDAFRELLKKVNSLVLAEGTSEDIEDVKALKAEDGKTINDLFVDAGIKLGEKLVLRRVAIVNKNDDEVFGPYIHMNGKIATLVVLKGGDSETANGVALNACSNNPTYRTMEDIPSEIIDREAAIELEASKQDPKFATKPEAIQKRIVEGKVKKVLGESVLSEELYILDDSKTIGQFLNEKHATVVSFVRFAVGEGIEKKKEDFAAEVAAQFSK
ncbi:MAG: translation elongation factor Ts [Bacilli bacterium]